MKKARYKIGIDPGTKTGIAVWCNEEKKLIAVNTMKIHEAILAVLNLRHDFEVEMVIEDPNTWVQFRQNNQAKARAQGAGSVKRDFAIWRDLCNEYQIPMRKVRLQGTIKKLDRVKFQKITGYMGRTSEHARDAAMLVFEG